MSIVAELEQGGLAAAESRHPIVRSVEQENGMKIVAAGLDAWFPPTAKHGRKPTQCAGAQMLQQMWAEDGI
jgi:hypothetical protein